MRASPPTRSIVSVLALLLAGPCAAVAADLSTLFTTPQERQIINANRYKSEIVKQTRQPLEIKSIATPIQQLLREEVSFEYKISGITVSSDGPHTVWINSLAYEEGEALDDNSRIKVMVGDEIRVRITAPDGKHYFATSGETLEITYLAPVEG